MGRQNMPMLESDWKMVIERQTRDLFTVIAALFAYAGLRDGETCATLPRRVYRYMLTILRPAEAAMRRLMIIAARGIVLKVKVNGAFPKGLAAKLKPLEAASDASERIAAFNFIDPLKHFAMPGDRKPFQPKPASFPRISVPGWSTPYFPPEPVPLTGDDPIDAAQIFRRLAALKHALETLPEQARRYVRWQTKRLLKRKTEIIPKPRRLWALRPGYPPGHRKKQIHLVDRILSDCCYFEREAQKKPDTS
jgi:hypothetical protein